MITQDYRPARFSEVLFQELPKRVLRAIAKNPEDKPQTITLSGPFGCGKTTMARIFAQAVNFPDKSGDVSLDSPISSSNLETSGIYTEYDSSVVGNVSTLRELQETFQFSTSRYRRTILFDEAQVISKEAQSALLRVTENVPNNVFFIFATTHPDDLLPALRSRSLELELTVVPDFVVRDRIQHLSQSLGMSVSDQASSLIVSRARGHLRDCDMLFDLYRILGDDFEDAIRSAAPFFIQFFQASMMQDRAAAKALLENLKTIPLAQLKSDFEIFMVDLTYEAVQNKIETETYVSELAKLLKLDGIAIVKFYLSPWGLGGFNTDKTFEMFMWSLYAVLSRIGPKRGHQSPTH